MRIFITDSFFLYFRKPDTEVIRITLTQIVYERAQHRKYKEINGRKDYIKHILHIISNVKWNFKCTIYIFLFIVPGTQLLNALQRQYKNTATKYACVYYQICHIWNLVHFFMINSWKFVDNICNQSFDDINIDHFILWHYTKITFYQHCSSRRTKNISQIHYKLYN